jgi:hypothetical protein
MPKTKQLSLERDKELIIKTRKKLELMANGMSESNAMIELNYQEALAKSPQAVLESDAWALAMESYIPKNFALGKHREMMMKTDESGAPHSDVNKSLDMYYKLAGKYVDKIDLTSGGKPLPANVIFNFNKKTEEQNDILDITDTQTT